MHTFDGGVVWGATLYKLSQGKMAHFLMRAAPNQPQKRTLSGAPPSGPMVDDTILSESGPSSSSRGRAARRDGGERGQQDTEKQC